MEERRGDGGKGRWGRRGDGGEGEGRGEEIWERGDVGGYIGEEGGDGEEGDTWEGYGGKWRREEMEKIRDVVDPQLQGF